MQSTEYLSVVTPDAGSAGIRRAVGQGPVTTAR